MKTRIPTAVLLLVIALPAMAFAQISGSSTIGPDGRMSMTMTFGPARMPAVVTGAPYSAEQVSESVQVLADGTRITRPGTPATRMYRDSEGRTRTERPMMPIVQGQQDGPAFVEILDPVAGCRYILDNVNRVAHRSVFEPPPQPGGPIPFREGAGQIQTGVGPPPAPGNTMRPTIVREPLGTQLIEGVVVEGTRMVNTYPAGSPMGNDRPISTVSEHWYSPELRLTVLTKTNDPRTGEHTMTLRNLSRAEPPRSLFQPPADYQVVDETGPFTIKITRP